MSTSTVSSLLNHLYYCTSNFKSPHFMGLSEAYDQEPLKYMMSQRKPNTVFMRQMKKHKNSLPGDAPLFAIDSDAAFGEASNLVLLKMGKYMERMFTTDSAEFNDYFVLDLATNKPRVNLTPEKLAEITTEDYFRYMMAGKMFLRS